MATDKTDAFDLAAGVPKIEGALRATPKFADRISKRVLVVVFSFIVLLVVIFLAALNNMDAKKKPAAPAEKAAKKMSDKDAEVAAVPKELKGSVEADAAGKASPSSLVKASTDAASAVSSATANIFGGKANEKLKPGEKKTTSKSDVPAIGEVGGFDGASIPKDPAAGVSAAPLTPEQQAENQEKLARRTRMTSARTNGLSAKSFDGAEKTVPAAAGGVNVASMLAAAKDAAAGMPAAQAKGDTEQDEKLAFTKNATKDDHGYHQHIPLAALSPNEIKTGSFIPMALEQSINSDLPGQITARVTEDVYDSITGCRMLIPAMAKVVGKYDSKVALGQGRMLVVWNSVIFPDGAELNLAGMQGYDTGGAAGLESEVDNHYWRMFGLTFGLSMITAGVQLSVPQPNPGVNGQSAPPTPAQTIATALAQQYGNLGSQILGKYMAVQPTLRNYAGERFVVMVPRTIVLPKVWRNRCMAKR